jgi:energy-coupling factor transporter ATP-binding protein EcfA2
MKIKELSLRSFKKFADQQTFSFHQDGVANDITLIVGENGSGKSSILQAIAMLVGGAVKPQFRPSQLDFPGFNFNYITNGRLPPDIMATIQFTHDEIEATREFSREVRERFPNRQGGERYVKPGNSTEISLFLDYQRDAIVSNPPKENLFQMKGYQYALQLSKFEPNFDRLLGRVGSVYTYHEQRTPTSITAPQNGSEAPITKVSDQMLRKLLVKWFYTHEALDRGRIPRIEGRRDVYAELNRLYNLVFRNRTLRGVTPKMLPDEILDDTQDVWFNDGRHEYEMSVMSGGERAIFPLLIDFANWNMNNSIILIDEIELHLHPPLQQTLVRALPLLGTNNQFIITSHSDDVAFLVPESQIIRL